MATPGIPFARWAADRSYLLIGPGVESTGFKMDNPETDLTATSVLALQTGTNRFVVTSVTGGTGDVLGPAGATDNALARFDGTTGKVIQSSTVLLDDGGGLSGVTTINGGAVPPGGVGDVVGPGSATNGAIALYSGTTGKLIQNSAITISGGAISGVTTINGSAPGNGDVVGPGSATNSAIATYSGTTGKIIQSSAVTISGGAISGVTALNGSAVPATLGDVVGPGSATSTAVALYNGTTGKLIQNSVVTISAGGAVAGVTTLNGAAPGNVVGPGSATNNAIATYSGTTGKLIQNSAVTIVAGAVAGVATLNGSAIPATIGNVVGPASATSTAVALYNGTTGKLIQNSVVTISAGGAVAGVTTLNGATPGNVVGPGSATSNAIATYSGATGKIIQNSVVTIVAGAVAGVTTLNGSAIPATIGNVVGPASATDTALARYNGTTGKLLQDSTATLDGSGQLTLAGVAFANVGFDNGPYLNNWQRTVFSATFSGPWAANQTGGLIMERVGNVVHIMEDLVTLAPANGAPAKITLVGTLPAAYRPMTGNKQGLIVVQSSNTPTLGQWDVSPAGVLTFGIGLGGSALPADGLSAGFINVYTIAYIIA